MKLLVKLGGTLLDSGGFARAVARQIAAARCAGHEVTVVHGGGKQMTRYLAERGIESRFVGGLRVTTPETVDAVLKVFAGTVNHELVASLNRAARSPSDSPASIASSSKPSRWIPRSAPSAASPVPTPPCCTC